MWRKCLAAALTLLILLSWMPVSIRAENTAEDEATTECSTTGQTTLMTSVPLTSTEVTTENPTEIPVETTVPVTEPPVETTVPPQETEPVEEEPTLNAGGWNLYVGQLHAHTVDSDGQGTVAEAFYHASQVEGLDFFAVTDHSDSLDNDKAGTLTQNGASVSQNWADGKAAAQSVTDGDFVGIYGFEMSWNQGQGHMSTFNTPGFLSRDRDGYKAYRDGLENYYDALLEVPDSVSQFNHPGTVYGDFKDFRYVSTRVDKLVTLIEVGSGAGREYQTSYDYYTRALDQGWHLSPTNNQNNHTGNFGDADTNRTVVLAWELTEAGIYDALRHYRTYATEDSDLQIYYTLNGRVMGSELSETEVGESVHLSVKLLDATDGQQGRVEVITTGGAVAASAAASANVEFSLPPAAYYYIRITQPDGDVAVTAPVWIRQRKDLGIGDLQTESSVVRAGETIPVSLTLFNNEADDLTVTAVTVTDQAGNLLAAADGFVLHQFDERELQLPICLNRGGMYTLTVTVSALYRGESLTFSENLDLSALPKAVLSDVLIDGTHGAETQYDGLSMLMGVQQITVNVETLNITQAQLDGCSLLIIPAPKEDFSEDFLNQIKDYVNQGKTLMVLGAAGGSEELNRLLEAVGASLTLNGDTAVDPVNNGGQPDQLFVVDFRTTDLTQGLLEGQTYAHISGCTLNAGDHWLVRSRLGDVLLAAEGNVILAGSNFLADAWLAVSDDPWALPFANRTIAENLMGLTRTMPEITEIAQVRKAEAGRMFLVEGLITAGTANPNTLFPDTVYLQDATGGIAALGCGDLVLKLGQRVRILGTLEIWDGNPQLRIVEIQLLGKEAPLGPKAVGSHLDFALQGGQLMEVKGEVVSAGYAGEAVLQFVVKNSAGNRMKVWIEDTILSGSTGKNQLSRIVRKGNEVSAVGFVHQLEGDTVLRLRDCDEVKLISAVPAPTTKPTETAKPTQTSRPTETTQPTEATTAPTELPAEPTEAPTRATETTEPTTPTQAETIPETLPEPEETEPAVKVPAVGAGHQKGRWIWWIWLLILIAAVSFAIRTKFRK